MINSTFSLREVNVSKKTNLLSNKKMLNVRKNALTSDVISFGRITKKIQSAEKGTITTATGVKYYLGAAVNKQKGANPIVDPEKFPESQRISYAEALKYKPLMEKAQAKIKIIYEGKEKSSYEWLSKDAIETEKARAKEIGNYVDKNYKGKIKDVIIVAMGGNIGTMKLAAGAVAQKVDGNTITAKNGVKFHFMDTLEPSRINDLKKVIHDKPKSTLICLVSQSGSTFETLAINTLLQDRDQLPKKNIISLIGTKDSAIGAMADSLKYKTQPNKMGDDLFNIPAWDRTGGRWTGNTAEPPLVIALGGGDPVKWVEGYKESIEDFIDKPFEENGIMQSALLDVAYSNKNFHNFFTFGYGDKLAAVGHALSQNVNESTASLKDTKNKDFGKGLVHGFFTCPATQHSDMATLTDFAQIPIKLRILEVQNDKSKENKISLNNLFEGKKTPSLVEDRAKSMDGLKPSHLMKTMAAATGFDAWKRGRPVEFVSIPELNEKTTASLLVDQYLRTMVWGEVNNINVVREMSFPDYKGAFKRATEELNSNILEKGATNIFYELTKK